MYGYEPPREPARGGWRDIVTLTWVGFTVVFPFLFVLIGVILLVVFAFVLTSIWVPLGLIPVALLGIAVLLFIARDRRVQAAREAELEDEAR